MKNQNEQIIEILRKTESDLQQVIVEAAQARDYRGVDMARTAAVNIQNLRARILNPASKLEPKSTNGMSPVKRKGLPRKGTRSAYPKFLVKNDALIRVGWSKKQRREYTHKTPRFVFDGTVKAMAALSQSGAGPFTAEQIIEQVNSIESETVPSYQIYVVIGLLRKTNCIKQIGREGYRSPEAFVKKAEKCWRKLSSKGNQRGDRADI